MKHFVIMTKRGNWHWDSILNEIDQLVCDKDISLTDTYAVLQAIKNHTESLLRALDSKLKE